MQKFSERFLEMPDTKKVLRYLNNFSYFLAALALVAFIMIGIKFKELEKTEEEIRQLKLKKLDAMAEKVLREMTGEDKTGGQEGIR